MIEAQERPASSPPLQEAGVEKALCKIWELAAEDASEQSGSGLSLHCSLKKKHTLLTHCLIQWDLETEPWTHCWIVQLMFHPGSVTFALHALRKTLFLPLKKKKKD